MLGSGNAAAIAPAHVDAPLPPLKAETRNLHFHYGKFQALKGVEMPITEQVYRIVHEDRPAGEALAELLGRRRRHERDDG